MKKNSDSGKKNALRALVIASLCGGVLAGCDDHAHEEESPNAEACEHIKEAPRDVTATATAADAPAIATDHRAYRVRLVDGAAGKTGVVKLAAGAAGTYLVYTNAAATLTVASASGVGVAARESLTSIPECTEVKGRQSFDLGVGTYTFTIASAEPAVTVLVEAPGE